MPRKTRPSPKKELPSRITRPHIVRNFFIGAMMLGTIASHAYGADLSPDAMTLDYGTGNVTRLAKANLQWDWNTSWFDSNGTHLSGYWDVSLAEWDGREWNDVQGRDRTFADVGFTPVFRFESDNKAGWFTDAGVGPNLLSRLYENHKRNFSTAFQFGDQVAVGYQTDRWIVGMMIEHFSNGGIKHPNPGANFALFSVGYRLGSR